MPSEKRPEEEDSPKPVAKRQRAANGTKTSTSSSSSKSSTKPAAKGKGGGVKGKKDTSAESKAATKKGKGKASDTKATASKAKKASPAKKTATETKSKKAAANVTEKKAPAKGKGGKAAKAKAAEKEKNVWKPVLCSTGLPLVQVAMLDGVLANKKAKLLDDFDHRVTHLLVNAFNVDDTPTRTIKLCKAIAAGIPLVCLKYLEESNNSSTSWPDVKPFIHSLTRPEDAPKIFADMHFFFGSLGSSRDMKTDLAEIVRFGGGKVLSKKPEIPPQPAEDEGSDDTTPPTWKLILVEDPDQADKKSGTAGRRVPLLAIRDAFSGAELVEPSWILDQCCPATKKTKDQMESKSKKKTNPKDKTADKDDGDEEMKDEVVPETEEPSEDVEKDKKLTDEDFVADSGGEDDDEE